MSPDFRARAAAKQAWLVRRSEPRRGLLLGLIGGGVIGCLGAFAVLSVLPSHAPKAAGDAVMTGTPARGAATARRPGEIIERKTASEASTDIRQIRQTSSDAAPAPENQGGKPGEAGAPALRAAPITTTFTAAAGAPPRAEPTRPDGLGRAEVPANVVALPVTAADPPATPSLTSQPPVLAEGEGTQQKRNIGRKKKKVIVERRPPVTVERRKPPRLHDWPGERRRPRLNDWAYGDNFFWGGGYRGW
jgi:hypothetical protein